MSAATAKRPKRAYQSFASGRRAEQQAKRPRYYALHPESEQRVTKRQWHYKEERTGVTFLLPRNGDGHALNYRVPTHETRTMLAMFPALSSRLTLVLNGHILEQMPDMLRPAIVVRVLDYNIDAPRQKRGRMRVEGIPGADRALILALTDITAHHRRRRGRRPRQSATAASALVFEEEEEEEEAGDAGADGRLVA